MCSTRGSYRVLVFLWIVIASTAPACASSTFDGLHDLGVGGDCGPGYFACHLEDCISESKVCDGIEDCPAGEDEMICHLDCLPAEEFECDDGTCVEHKAACDGKNDCTDSSDEKYCDAQGRPICKDGEVKCLTTTECIPAPAACDGERDCGDGSDEENCVDFTCPSEQFRCGNTTDCIPADWKCDGRKDCEDDSDEKCSKEVLNCKTFVCADKSKCLSYSDVCNGHPDCPDGSDEVNNCHSVCQRLKCDHGCLPLGEYVTCECQEGYATHPTDLRICEDIDECVERKPGKEPACSQVCMNTQGSYKCDCEAPYELGQDKRTCVVKGFSPLLLVSSMSQISRYNMDRKTYDIILKDLHVIDDIDVDAWNRRVFWIDSYFKKVFVAGMTGKGSTVVDVGLTSPTGIGYNWLSDLLYVVDSLSGTIVACTVTDVACANIVTGLSQREPDDITVDPLGRHIYWTEIASPVRIMRSGLDGRSSGVFVEAGLVHPNHLVLDYPTYSLYWVDTKMEAIFRTSLNGDAAIEVVISYDVRHPSSLAVLGDVLVWAERKSGRVLQANKFTGKGRRSIWKNGERVTGVAILHHALQLKADSPCSKNPCGKVCVETGDAQNYACLCPPLMVLHRDGHSCIWSENSPFLLIGGESDILQIPVHNVGHFSVRRLSAPGLRNVDVLDINPITGQIAFSVQSRDGKPVLCKSGSIRDAHFNFTMIEDRAEILGQAGSLAVDWAANQVFWLNEQKKKVEIFQIEGSGRGSLHFQDDLRSMTINVTKGLLFYSVWGPDARIMVCHMNGSECSILVDHRVSRPDHLFSFADRLYWTDTDHGFVSSISYNGTDRTLHLQYDFSDNTSDLILLSDHELNLYVTGSNFPQFKLSNMAVFVPKDQVPSLPCAENNGGCSDICLTLPDRRRRCLCPDGKSLDSDLKTCQDGAGEVSCLAMACDHLCTPTPVPTCSCDQGFHLTADRRTCNDIDECAVRNGNCSQLCSNARGSYRCTCVQGYKLLPDKATCYSTDHASAYLLVSTSRGIYQVPMDGGSETPYLFDLPPPLSFDVFPRPRRSDHDAEGLVLGEDRLILAEQLTERKNFSKIYDTERGSTGTHQRAVEMRVVVVRVEEVTRSVYYVTFDGRRCQLTVCNEIIQDCVHLLSSDDWAPGGLIFHPTKRMMYWTDMRKSVIHGAYMDGRQVQLMMRDVYTMLNGLVLDTIQERFYWVDHLHIPFASTIHTARLDGSDRYQLKTFRQRQFLSVDLFDGFLYLTEKNSNKVQKVSSFSARPVLSDMREMKYDIHTLRVVHSPRQVPNPCASKSCPHLCVLSSAGSRCLCPDGLVYNKDTNTCDDQEVDMKVTNTSAKSNQLTNSPTKATSTRRPLGTRRPPTFPIQRRKYTRRPFVPGPTRPTASFQPRPNREPSQLVCVNAFCANGGFCHIVDETPKCMCSEGFSGPRCKVAAPQGVTEGSDSAVSTDGGYVNVTLTAKADEGLSPGVVATVVVVVLVAVSCMIALGFWYHKKWRNGKGRMFKGVECRLDSDKASLVRAGEYTDEFHYCKWDLDGNLLDTSDSSSDSAVFSNNSSPQPIFRPATPLL